MKLRTLSLALAAVATGAALYAFQDKKNDKPMQMETPQPMAEHKVLQRSVGTWDALTEMGGQAATKGTMVYELGPGGFTVVSHFKGEMGGGPFEGRGVDGYDAMKKKYVSLWTDSWTSAPMLMDGTWDEKTQTMTMMADMPDMATGKMVKHKLVTKWADNDHCTFDIIAPGADGKDATMMTIKYTRKK